MAIILIVIGTNLHRFKRQKTSETVIKGVQVEADSEGHVKIKLVKNGSNINSISGEISNPSLHRKIWT